MSRGDSAGAAKLLERAVENSPDASTLLRLAAVRRALGNHLGALEAAKTASSLAPDDWLALLLLGSLSDALGAAHAGGRAYRAASARAPSEGLSPQLRQQLAVARRRAAAEEQWRNHLATWQPRGDATALTSDERARIDEFRLSVLRGSDEHPSVPPLFMLPGLPEREFLDPSDFPGVDTLEAATGVVRDEFLALAERMAPELSSRLAGLHGPQSEADAPGKWSMIPLIKDGRVVERFAAQCPETMRLFREVDSPDIALVSPSLYFSVVEPHGRIAPHRGLTNARFIVHWPLITPESCGFRVGEQTREWVPGRALVFDDMTEHEVWNDSDRIRVILIGDLWRPELSRAERAAITQLMQRPLEVESP
jgi:aspartyl/asparaginyl beta-hydroxylase (cupin superfamily)